jgi:hypothetical protein
MPNGGTIATRGLLHAPASSGRDLLGGRMQLTFASVDTDGAYTLCVGLTPPGLGPPLHVHAIDDQTHYVVRGTYELVSGPDVVIAEQGACAWWRVPSSAPSTRPRSSPR